MFAPSTKLFFVEYFVAHALMLEVFYGARKQVYLTFGPYVLILYYHAGRLLYPVYVNHHIRPEEELSREIALNKANCEKLGLRLVVEDIDSRRLGELAKEVGTEQAARQLRYEILIGFAKEHQAVLATAHTADDQLETLLMRLLQGSSAIHLAIAPKVVFEGVAVYHPLLGFSHGHSGQWRTGGCAFPVGVQRQRAVSGKTDLRTVEGRVAASAVQNRHPGCFGEHDHRTGDGKSVSEGCHRQVLWRRHQPEAEIVGKTEGRQETHVRRGAGWRPSRYARL